jgi:Raf kinase inhibitor-like YbhB/YbcL family protein
MHSVMRIRDAVVTRLVLAAVLLASGVYWWPAWVVSAQGPAPAAGAQAGRGPAGPPMTMAIAAFPDGGPIPPKYTQAGEQVSPAIAWMNAPANTQSFVLHFHDAEVARNRTTEDQLHWIVWNIPGTATGLPEGVPMGDRPDGSHQQSASGAVYRGPGAPANGPLHHYTFEVFALDTKLDVTAATDPFDTRTNVFKAMQGHVLGKAVYVGMFKRPQ